MSSLIEENGKVYLTFNDSSYGQSENYSLHTNPSNGWVALGGSGYTVTFHLPSAAVAAKLSELFARTSELMVEEDDARLSEYIAQEDARLGYGDQGPDYDFREAPLPAHYG